MLETFETDPHKVYQAAQAVPTAAAHEHTRFVSQVLLFSPQGNLLTLLKRREKSVPGWDLPGGGVDPNESFLETAFREYSEESRIAPLFLTPFAYSVERGGDKPDYVAFTFLSALNDEMSPVVDNEEHR